MVKIRAQMRGDNPSQSNIRVGRVELVPAGFSLRKAQLAADAVFVG